MPSSFSIRPALPSDVDAVERIRSDFAADSGWPRAPLHPAARAAFVAGRGMPVWLAEAGGETVGFASACAVQDLFDGPGAWLSDIYVAPAWRRHGAGRALVDAVAAWTRTSGGEYLAWHTGRANVASQAFYAALGAEARPDHLYMSLSLIRT